MSSSQESESERMKKRLADSKRDLEYYKAEYEKSVQNGLALSSNAKSVEPTPRDTPKETLTSRSRGSATTRSRECMKNENSPRRMKTYDVDAAREFMKKQKEKRTEMLKAQLQKGDNPVEIKKQKLKELHEKSLKIIAKNARDRSRSRESARNADPETPSSPLRNLDINHPLKDNIQTKPLKILSNIMIKPPVPSMRYLKPPPTPNSPYQNPSEITKAALTIQKYFRGYKQRKLYKLRLRKKRELEAQLLEERLNREYEEKLRREYEERLRLEELERLRKEEEKQKSYPEWLQPSSHTHPYNFISTVKRKLNMATTKIDMATQSTPQNSSREIREMIQKSIKKSESDHESAKKEDLKSFLFNKCLDLDLKKVESLKLSSKITDMSDSDTSKNIPDLSAESLTSKRANYESSFETYSKNHSKSKSSRNDGLLSRSRSPIDRNLDVRTHTSSSSSKNSHETHSRSKSPDVSVRSKKSKSPTNLNSEVYSKKSSSRSKTSQSINEEMSTFSKIISSNVNDERRQNSTESKSSKASSNSKSLSEESRHSKKTASQKSTSRKSPELKSRSKSPSYIESRSNSAQSSTKSHSRQLYKKSVTKSETLDSYKKIHSGSIPSETHPSSKEYHEFVFKKPPEPPIKKLKSKPDVIKIPLSPIKTISDAEDDYQINMDPLNKLKLMRRKSQVDVFDDNSSTNNSIISSNKTSYNNKSSSDKSPNVLNNIGAGDHKNVKNVANESYLLASFRDYMKDYDVSSKIGDEKSESVKSFATMKSYKSESTTKRSGVSKKSGSDTSVLESYSSRFTSDMPSLKAPKDKLQRNHNEADKENRDSNVNEIVLKAGEKSSIDTRGNSNQIHVKFEAELHLLNDFNESLRQIMAVEKSILDLHQNKTPSTIVLQNRDTQTSMTKSSSEKFSRSGVKSSTPRSINTSRGSEVGTNSRTDAASQVMDEIIGGDSALIEEQSVAATTGFEISDIADMTVDQTHDETADFSLSHCANQDNPENVYAGLSLGMFEQMIKDEDARIENMKTMLKIREKALMDRTKGELAWLEIQKKNLLETGKLHEASLLKKKQRGIVMKLQQEKHELQKLKQMQKAASIERKTILKEQHNLIKAQLASANNNIVTKIRKSFSKERRGPVKVYNYHREIVRSESVSRKSSAGEDIILSSRSESQSVRITENNDSDLESDRRRSLKKGFRGENIEIAKRSLLKREADLQKRKKEAEELLKWHQKLLEEERKISELEMAASNIINQAPVITVEKSSSQQKYSFEGGQLNVLWKNMTGREEKKFKDNKTYNLSSLALERFCKDAKKTASMNNVIEKRTEPESETYTGEFARENEVKKDAHLEQGIKNSESKLNEMMQNISNITEEISELYKLSKNGDGIILSSKNTARRQKEDSISEMNVSHKDVPEESSVSVKSGSRTRSERVKSRKRIKSSESEDVAESSQSIPSLVVTDINEDEISVAIDDINQAFIDDEEILSENDAKLSKEDIETKKSSSDISIKETAGDKTDNDIITEEFESNIEEILQKSSEDKSAILSMSKQISSKSMEKSKSSKSEMASDKVQPSSTLSDKISDENVLEKSFIEIPSSESPEESKTSTVTPESTVQKSIEDNLELNSSKTTDENLPQEILSAIITSEKTEDVDVIAELSEDMASAQPTPDKITSPEISEEPSEGIAKVESVLEEVSEKIASPTNESVEASQESTSVDSESQNSTSSADVVSNEKQSDEIAIDELSLKDLSREVADIFSEQESDGIRSEIAELKVVASPDILSQKESDEITSGEKLESEKITTKEISSESLSHVISKESNQLDEGVSPKNITPEVVTELVSELAEISPKLNEVKSPKISSDSNILVEGKENTDTIISTGSIQESVEDEIHSVSLSEVHIPTSADGLSFLKDIQGKISSILTEKEPKILHHSFGKQYNEASYDSEDDSSKITDILGEIEPSFLQIADQFDATVNNDTYEVETSVEKSQAESEDNQSSQDKITTEHKHENISHSQKLDAEDKFSFADKNSLEIQSVPSNASLQSQEMISPIALTPEEDEKELSNESIHSQNAESEQEHSLEDSQEDNVKTASTIDTSSDETSINIPIINVKIGEKHPTNKDNDHENEVKDETTPKGKTLDVKKRVSEIMADANIVSFGDKSPRMQDLYVTTYDVLSPANSPELGSPVDGKGYLPPKDILGTEAEELLRKQLAIEQEIKQLEQQQKEQLPYLYLREIPNKPPPPYKPPVQSSPPSSPTFRPTSIEQITSMTPEITEILYKAYKNDDLQSATFPEDQNIKNVDPMCADFIFELCKETAIKHYSQFEEITAPSWLRVSKYNYKKPLETKGLENLLNDNLKKMFGFEIVPEKESRLTKWSRKKRDHVYELLVSEMQAEEADWTNYDQEEMVVKNELTNDIMNVLLSETTDILQSLFTKHALNDV